MKYCQKCGWLMEYQPRSFQEYIKELIGDQKRRGRWICPNCGSLKSWKNQKNIIVKNNKKKS